MTRYYLTQLGKPEREVAKEEFVRAERAAGFHNTLGQPAEPATAGFSNDWQGVRGSIRCEPDPPPPAKTPENLT